MKKVRDGYKMTELGEIPNEWEIIKLNECGYIFGGNAFKSSSFTTEYKENDYQVIRMGNVQLGKLDLEKNPVFLSENLVGEKEKKYLLKEADILISLTGTVNKTDYGNISWVDKNNKYLLNQRVGCLRNDNGEFNNRYYYYLLQSNMFRNQFFECGVGGTGNQANVSIADLNNIKVLKLPTREQEKIASILSTVDEQIDNVDALIEKNKELKKGLMQTLLTKGIGHTKFKKTEIGEIPEEWEVIKFDNIISFLTDYEANGSFSSIKENVNIFDEPNYAYFVRATDLEKKDYINSVKYVDKESYKFLSKTSLNGGELLIAKRGQIGKVYLMPNLDKKATLAPNLYLIKLDNEKANNKYVYYYFISSIGQKRLISNSASTTLGAIYKDDVKKIKMVLPSIKEQEKIVLILSEIDEKIDGYENRREKLEELKKGLMQQLLTGKIRVI